MNIKKSKNSVLRIFKPEVTNHRSVRHSGRFDHRHRDARTPTSKKCPGSHNAAVSLRVVIGCCRCVKQRLIMRWMCSCSSTMTSRDVAYVRRLTNPFNFITFLQTLGGKSNCRSRCPVRTNRDALRWPEVCTAAQLVLSARYNIEIWRRLIFVHY